MDKEIWKDIKHYEGIYKISNHGRVWSIHKRDYKTPSVKDNGYLVVQLYKNGKMHNEYIHRLVALTFIPNPNNLPQVNHKDECKKHNSVDNLEWCDCTYNNNYGTARERGTHTRKEKGLYENARKKWLTNNPSRVNPKLKGDNSNAKSVMCDGVLFDCIKTCAEYYGINYGTMRYWLSGEGNVPEYFKEHNLHYI